MGIYANMCTIGPAGTTKFPDNLCPKIMCFVRLWIYLSNMVKLPNILKLFYYQISTFHCSCLTVDRVGTSVFGEIRHFVYWFKGLDINDLVEIVILRYDY